MFRRLRSVFRVLRARNEFESGMTEELRFHMEQYAQDLIAAGESAQEAFRRACIEFGGMNSVQAECREARHVHLFDDVSRDLRYAVRSLRKAPAFTLTVLLTLALCLGANLTMLAVIDAVLVWPLPFPAAGRLVTIFNTYPKAGVERDGSSITNYYERRGALPALASLSIYRFGEAIVGRPGSTVREQITQVSPEFFTTLGRGPAIGRAFTESEMTYGTDGVVILTDAYWRRHFNADPQVIGRTVWVNRSPETVVGVLPPRFRFLSSKAQLYRPLSSRLEDRTPDRRHSGGNVIQIVARLRPGATLGQAQAQIDVQNAALEQDDPKAKMMADAGFRSLVVSLHSDQVAAVRPVLLLLKAGVLALLLIGVVNLVNLFLIRASGRSKELTVRQALGASRRYLALEVFTETAVLTVLGGLLAMAVGAGGIRLLAALGANRLPFGEYIVFDARLAFAALIAAILLGGVLAAPMVWFQYRADPAAALQSESRSATGNRAAQALRHAFVVAQVALGFALLVGTGLLGLSLERAMSVSPGFEPAHAAAGQISLVGNRYTSPATGLAFTDRLLDELRRQPGISAAGIASNIPLSGNNGKSAATADGRVLRPGESVRGVYAYAVSGDYFEAMGLSLQQGRPLTAADSHHTERSCVVDEDFARFNWPDRSPLGQRIFEGSDRGSPAEAFTVVGVVGSIKQAGLTDDTAQGAVYYPYIYRADSNIFVVVRGALAPEALESVLARVVRQIDPELTVNGLGPMSNRITESLAGRRSPALIGGAFSGMALLLIAIGTYGVLSYAVAQRRREIAIRMALGARPAQIRSHFLWLAVRLLSGGAILGFLGAWMTGRAMQAVLFHVPAHDSAILSGSAALVAIVSLIACLVPARRAARVSPMRALADQ